MAKFRIAFNARVEREIEVPEDLVWHECYAFARDNLGFHEIAHSFAAKITVDTDSPRDFVWLTRPSALAQARIDAVPSM